MLGWGRRGVKDTQRGNNLLCELGQDSCPLWALPSSPAEREPGPAQGSLVAAGGAEALVQEVPSTWPGQRGGHWQFLEAPWRFPRATKFVIQWAR